MNIVYNLLLSILSPLLSLFILLKSGKVRNIVINGVVIMVVLGSVFIYLPGSDGATHLNTISAYNAMSVFEFLEVFAELLALNDQNAPGGITDPYLHTIGFLSVGVFGVPELLHVIAAFFYGLIYFSILKIVFKHFPLPKGLTIISIVFFIFFMHRGITGFNSIRWWTAFWLLFYSFLSYWQYDRKRLLFLSLLTPYIHYSFVAFVPPVLFGLVIYSKPKLVLSIWLLSFFFGASYDMIKPYVPALKVIEKKEKFTLDEDRLTAQKEARDNRIGPKLNFYKEFGESSFRYLGAPILSVFLFLIRNHVFERHKNLIAKLFASGLMLYSLGNFMDYTHSVHNRALSGAFCFLLLATFFSLITMRNTSNSIYKSYRIKIFIYLFIIGSIPGVLYHLSYSINILSSFSLMLAPISWFLGVNDFSIKHLFDNFLLFIYLI